MMVKLHGRYRSEPIFICAECTRPRILAVPTPLAIPANRVSNNRMMPHRSAQLGDTAALYGQNMIISWETRYSLMVA